MKRLILSASMLGLMGLFVGCDETSKTESTTKTSGPGGSEKKTVTVEDKKTGDMKTGEGTTKPAP